jgi:nucleoside-diphosphate-sugar epimerase
LAKPTQTIVITGAAGFLGTALADALGKKFQLIGMDISPPKKTPAGMSFIKIDFSSEESVSAAWREVHRSAQGKVAAVIHLAAYYDLTGEPNPKYEQVTIEGTRRLLRALQQTGVERFVFASTMLVHAPCEPGQKIDEAWPIAPRWVYPESKAVTERLILEERGDTPVAILRFAGVYDEQCHAAFLAQQIARIYERLPTSILFAGDPSHGQPYLHLADMVDAVVRVVDRRRELPPDTVLLLGETETPSYGELQTRLGQLIHGVESATLTLPKELAKAGAWMQEEVLREDMFIKPWMIEIADDHYELDIRRAQQLLGWTPRHKLLETLPAMVKSLKADPTDWYAINKLEPATVAASQPELVQAEQRLAQRPAEAVRKAEEKTIAAARRMLWSPLANIALGAWLVASPFAYGLFDAVVEAVPPPAAGMDLPAPGVRDALLAYSEMLSGAALILLTALSLRLRGGWMQWIVAVIGTWVMFAPLVFWTTSSAAYAADSLLGMLVIAFAVIIPPTPGVSAEALSFDADRPLGWSYSPSTFTQRLPIAALAFVGFFVSRYLGAFQLGHTDTVWDPFFGPGTLDARNGTEAVITSSVSKSFPIADAAFGAIVYAFDILAGIIGDRRRWRTMPWMVLLFGLLIVPLGAVSVVFIIIQPTIIGAICTLCLLQAAITVILIPYSIDEVLASVLYLINATRAGESFWGALFHGGPSLSEDRNLSPDLDRPAFDILKDFAVGGVNFPWTLVASVSLGVWLMATPLTLGTAAPLYFSDHVTGCLVITIAVTAMAEVARPLRFLNIALGIWVAASGFLLEGSVVAGALPGLVAGVALILLSLPLGTRSKEHYGVWDRFIV